MAHSSNEQPDAPAYAEGKSVYEILRDARVAQVAARLKPVHSALQEL
jgi:hypothetical protein